MSPIVDGSKKPVKEPEKSFEETAQETETKPFITMSEEDAYIYDRMKSQPKSLEEALFVKEKRYAPGEHRLSLPKEFLKYEDRFVFRWLNKKKRAIDDGVLKGWIIVNRNLFPEEAKGSKYLFSTSGAVEKGDAILAFMKKEIAEQIRRAPGDKSSAMVKAQLQKGDGELPEGKSGFYKPKDTGEKEDDSGQGTGIQEGRDF